eukprot:Skav209001  [mRNA]  locus=scaffold2686:256416:257549:- [translate_table: standard]
MDEKDVKLARLIETVGDGADLDFAREVLIATNWDLQAAVTMILGDGVQAAPAAPTAPSASSARASAAPQRLEHVASDEVRAPMRTGFVETLLTTDAAEQARQDKEREEERLRVEAERIATEERLRKQAEEAHKKNLARMAEEQRSAAERKAIERKKQKAQEEQEDLRSRRDKKGRRDDDSDEDLDDIPIDSGIMLADLSNQLAQKVTDSPARPGLVEESAPAPPSPSAPTPASVLEAAPAAVEPCKEVAKGVDVPDRSPDAKADPFISALREMRKKHREAEPAALAACFRVLTKIIRNVIEHPGEAKYQRIKAETFRSKAGDLAGSLEVLEACGFHPDEPKEFLVIDPDYARTQGLRLRENERKIELLLEELEKAGF